MNLIRALVCLPIIAIAVVACQSPVHDDASLKGQLRDSATALLNMDAIGFSMHGDGGEGTYSASGIIHTASGNYVYTDRSVQALLVDTSLYTRSGTDSPWQKSGSISSEDIGWLPDLLVFIHLALMGEDVQIVGPDPETDGRLELAFVSPLTATPQTDGKVGQAVEHRAKLWGAEQLAGRAIIDRQGEMRQLAFDIPNGDGESRVTITYSPHRADWDHAFSRLPTGD